MAEKEQNRTEQATPFKLDEARKQGQVAKSLDFNTLLMVWGLIALAAIWGAGAWNQLAQIWHHLFAGAAELTGTSITSGGDPNTAAFHAT